MITRFAPSPTGPLHLGHAFSAMLAHDMARAAGGTFLLRIEDIDRQRSKPEWEQAIFDDLAWLGLTWEEPVMRQSDRMTAYRDALKILWERDLLYPCSCNRGDIREAATAPNEGEPLSGPDGIVYPGTCRSSSSAGGLPNSMMPMPDRKALRLWVGMAEPIAFTHRIDRPGRGWQSFASFQEDGYGPSGDHGLVEFTAREVEEQIGDVVVSRRDMGTSYHLAVVVDDAAQGVSHVVRGQDLFEATKIHVLLQRLLGLPTPVYHHHRLIRDDTGKRLAKRDDARAIANFRAEGATPADIRRMVGL